MNDIIQVWQADWFTDQATICPIRQRVFIDEQQVPESLEWDGLDNTAIHVLGHFAGGPAAGTARLLPTGQIGRLAVLPELRGRGLGRRLLETLLAAADSANMAHVFLHAQLPLVDFYRRYGFEPINTEFMEAGIRHRLMSRR